MNAHVELKEKYKIIDYTKQYKSIMQFNKNKNVSIHQWYPFVEGYSKEFIQSILDELDYTPTSAIDPFSGSGTTAVELQEKGIKCTSFEVSPFMYLLSSVKINQNYDIAKFCSYVSKIKTNLKTSPQNIREIEKIPFGRTVVKTEKLKKWNFHDDVLDGLLDIKHSIKKIKDEEYRNLFKIALASITLDVSNLFRNGKCLSYKKKWVEKNNYKREDIHKIFINRIESIFLEDIKKISDLKKENSETKCIYGDVRESIDMLENNSVDLIITSPPYLNSRDYTDIYMLELKIIDLIQNYEDLLSLRKRTLRSHVQVNYSDLPLLEVFSLKQCIAEIEEKKDEFWNADLLNMIKGYFLDIDFLFSKFKEKMKKGKFIYFNVANSAYFGVEIPVDIIISEIAEKNNLEVIEIRKARDLKTSAQQAKQIKSLRESVIVIKS